jgi:putative nucleotidyltransferase with HDIG domain
LHQLAEALGNAVDARDPGLFRHSRDVADVACILAGEMGFSGSDTNLVHIAGHLHDIGKIGIPDAVLNKRGPLDADEWRWIQRHPEIGAAIVRPVPALNASGGVAEIILSHHERFDGSGYPRRLSGHAIPPGARIVALADSLSALLSNRSYRRGCTFEEALSEIRLCSGSQFDPEVVHALLKCSREVRERLLECAEPVRESWRERGAPCRVALST